MKYRYLDLIEQACYIPQEGFGLRDDNLTFHGVSLKHLIDKHGTPFRFIYLPKIGDQIKKARNLFNRAIKKHHYQGQYYFCYCTKCKHFYYGIKTEEYLRKILTLQETGFYNSIIILDSMDELERLLKLHPTQKVKIGLRMAINEEAQSACYTSRMGIAPSQIIEFLKRHIRNNENVELIMLHFFVDTGIKDTLYYWGEFQKALKLYVELKKESEGA